MQLTPFASRYLRDDHETIDVYGYASPLVIDDFDREYAAVREGVALLDFSMLLKVDVEGPGAKDALDRLVARDLGQVGPGAIAYGPLVDADGMMIDDCTVMVMSDDRVRVVGGPGMPGQVIALAQRHGLTATPRREELAHVCIQGPSSRELLSRLTAEDVANAAFPYYTFREAMIVGGVGVFATRLGFTAELGYELFVPVAHAIEVWDALLAAGADLGVRPVGAATVLTARTEAGMIMGELEYDATVSPYECSLGWAVSLDTGDFQGRNALRGLRDTAPNRLMSVVLERGGEAATDARLFVAGEDVGHVTMAVTSPFLDGATLGLARVSREIAAPGTGVTAMLENDEVPGELRRTPVYDPERQRVRS